MANGFAGGLAGGLQAGIGIKMQQEKLAQQEVAAQQKADEAALDRAISLYKLGKETKNKGLSGSAFKEIQKLTDGVIDGTFEEEDLVGDAIVSLRERNKLGEISTRQFAEELQFVAASTPFKEDATKATTLATSLLAKAPGEEIFQASEIANLPPEVAATTNQEQARTQLLTQSEEGRKILAEEAKPTGAGKKAINMYLPGSKEVVISHDNGRTYLAPDGSSIDVPSDALVIGGEAPISETRGLIQQAEIEKGLDKDKEGAEKISKDEKNFTSRAEEAAKGGTGPYAKLKAGVNAVFGGLGFDAAFGKKDGFFPDTQENRQFLNILKQTGKEALLNSARGAIWEQEKIDQLFADPSKFWTNPETEAGKFTIIRDMMTMEKEFNNKAMLSPAASPEEITTLRDSNRKIDLLLSFLSQEATAQPTETTTVLMPDGSTQTFDASGKRIQ